jgi:hypothetical protein
MVLSTVVGGMWEIAASTAAFCSWESVGGIPAQRLSASSSQRISGWDDDSQRAMGWDGTVTPNAASLWARSELRTDWNPGRGNGCGLSAGLVFRRGGMVNSEEGRRVRTTVHRRGREVIQAVALQIVLTS